MVKDYTGILVTDGYAGYSSLEEVKKMYNIYDSLLKVENFRNKFILN